MEFKFRAVDDRPPLYLPPSSSIGCFSDMALRANCSTVPSSMRDPRDFYTIQREIDERIRQEIIATENVPNSIRDPNDVYTIQREIEKERIRQELIAGENVSTVPSSMREPRDIYIIQREIEKERIRQEIIAAENVRRRVLEEEVRRELMMEREMALCRESKMGLSIDERLTMRLDSRYPLIHQFDNRWLEDQLTFPRNRGLGFGLDVSPSMFPRLSRAVTRENETSLEVNKKDKLIMLAKPDPNLCGAKRNAPTPPAHAGELPLMSLKKKSKEEWSCALCRVSATNERGLNQHLQGKKHKAKEAALRAQKMLHNGSTTSLPKKSRKRSKPAATNNAVSELEKKEEGSFQPGKIKDGSDQKMEDGPDLKSRIGVPPAEKVNMKKEKLKFWCEICHIGAHSEVVIEAHKKGKKHKARLRKHNQNSEAVAMTKIKTTTTSTTITVVASPEPTEKAKDIVVVASPEPTKKAIDVTASPEPSEKAKDVDVVAEEANEETSETVPGDLGAQDHL